MHYIIEDLPKGLCNSLWGALYVYAYALNNNHTVYIPALKEHSNKIEFNELINVKKNIFIENKYPYLNKLLFKVLNIKTKNMDAEFSQFENLFKIRKINSWKEILNNSNKDFIINRNYIRSQILPKKNDINKIKLKFSNDYEILGLHLRGGDYKNWRKGTFYFDENIFMPFIDDWLNKKDKRKCFIATNEEKWKINLINYFGDKIITSDNVIQDLWGLSKSNWIIGPPSTFSQFASFWNNTPIRFILKKDDYQKLTLPKSYIIALNIFSSGSKLSGHQNGLDFIIKGKYA